MNISILVDIQRASTHGSVPPAAQIRRWARHALGDGPGDIELAIRIVDEEEGRTLNAQWRKQDKATNVLSFPCPPHSGRLLGDIVVCAAVVEREAAERGKPVKAHWAHMIVHGTLHLLGHDHIEEDEARIMCGLERDILNRLGFPDPYADEVP